MQSLKFRNGYVISPLYQACNYFSMLGLKLNHVGKMDPWVCTGPALELWICPVWCWLLHWYCLVTFSLIARFMGPTWGPHGADRAHMGPMLATWTLLYGLINYENVTCYLLHFVIDKTYDDNYSIQMMRYGRLGRGRFLAKFRWGKMFFGKNSLYMYNSQFTFHDILFANYIFPRRHWND